MSLDRERVKELFLGALDVSPDRRAAFLDAACAGDVALLQEVESLLVHHDDRELITACSETTAVEALLASDLAALPEPALGEAEARYRELFELGVGGAGRVTCVWDRWLRRRIAKKELLDPRPVQRAMLLQEARLLAWLDHPGTVPVYDIDAGPGETSYTMRHLPGQTLRARLGAAGPLSVHEAIRILTRISEAMANAHAKGVLHLDLKPANLMLLPYGQVCILDWGVARFHDLASYRGFLRDAGEGEAPEAAAYQGIAGTPSYMPVEQSAGRALSRATDIYAAGTILYEMLVGRLPRSAGRLEDQLESLRAHRVDVPERLEALCLAMLAADLGERPASFDEVLVALDDLIGVDVGVERTLDAGEVLFREGEPADHAYQIRQGCLAVTVEGASGPTELARRTVGDLIGELGVVLEAPRSATVTAVEPTRVAVVTREVLTAAVESASPLVARMLRSLSSRLREEAERVKRR